MNVHFLPQGIAMIISIIDFNLYCSCKEYARIKKDFAHPKSSSSKQQRIPSPPIQTPEIRSNQQQLQGHNQNRKCITKHHQFIYHPFLSCLNMKYIACKWYQLWFYLLLICNETWFDSIHLFQHSLSQMVSINEWIIIPIQYLV